MLRRTAPGLKRPFLLRAYKFWSPVSFLAAVLILYWSGFSVLTNVITATFIGLPFFTIYYAWRHGWMKAIPSISVSVVFFVLWIWVAVQGGWVLATGDAQRPGSWPFPVYYIVFCALVIGFCAVVWIASSAEGRVHVTANWWLIWLLLASLLVGYLGEYGPMESPALGFPGGMITEVVVGIIAYMWAIHSGFATDEIKDIVTATERAEDAAASHN